MLSSAKIGTSSWRYYTAGVACAATDYYIGAGEAPGRWSGRGLAELSLDSDATVSESELEALFARALHPVTGERLGRAWRRDGVTGFDLTFSAPKSVSSLWALGDPDTASSVRAAHRAAVAAALTYLDTHASWSRRGMDGVEQTASAGLVAASFEHRTSRCGDPQLHTHALVVNKVRCADGRWRTLDATELYHHKKSAGMVYQAALRSELHARVGVVFEEPNAHGQAEIAGIPAGLLKLWSKRAAQIEPEAAVKIAEYENSLGRSLTSAEQAAVTKAAVLKTRPGKTHPDQATLGQAWADEAERAGYRREEILANVRAAAVDAPLAPTCEREEVAAAAVAAAAGARATFSRADVAGQVAARVPVDGRGAAEVLRTVEALTDRALGLDEAVSVGRQPHGVTARASDERWAGAEVLAAEARVLSLADRGRGGGYGRVPAASLVLALEDAGLDATQRAAVWAIAEGGDFLSVLTAPAGAGKTRTLGLAAEAWSRAGHRVLGLAPSARAAAELADATGSRTDTLAKWVYDHARRGRMPADARARVVLDARSVVIVDEASMANTHALDTLITAAARAGAKVVLVGDPAQIGVVNGPGGMLAALAAAGHGIELAGVHRFRQDWERDASLALRRGDPAGLTAYRDQDRLHACADGDGALDGVHAQWAAERAAGREVLMMARTRADVDALNTRARATAQAAGDISGPVVRLGERDWQAGDLLRTRRNDRTLPAGDGHVRNGDRWRVLTAQQDGLLVEHLDRGDRTFLPAAYAAAHAEYGWAATINAAQGATVDVGLVLVRPGIDREHLYVALTRGRDANHAYITPDTATDLDDRHGLPLVGRSGATDQERALDVLATALASSGAQDAAHTARENARVRPAEQARRAAEDAARRAAEPGLPAEHAARPTELTLRQQRRDQLNHEQREHRQAAAAARIELAGTSWLRPARRRDLAATITEHEQALLGNITAAAQLHREIDELTRQLAADARSRETEHRARALQHTSARSARSEVYLAPAASVETIPRLSARTRRALESAAARDAFRSPERSSRRAHEHMHDRGRDDAPGIGW
ncbi:MobF family relaxase [Sporichthya polymorpha]|uniref:MobF family relaxase n=1 Tax=Sporichthya polymorpha TaxID=35751 RepID=UPI00039FED65|nr:MobF family relaxase [Sporichthya polymorpha]